MIENLKDKALVIFDVYLLIGHNYYLEIESFKNCPLIIKPFEVYSKQFPPIEYYYSNNIKVKLNEMLESKDINKRLVLSTSNGKYIVKSNKKQWFLIQDIFKNNQTMWITPIRYNLNGIYYPPNAVYVVEITMANKKENVPIYTSFYNYSIFEKFNLTQDALESAEQLELFLISKAEEGLLNCVDLKVIDLKKNRSEESVYSTKSKEVFKARYLNWLEYFIYGKLCTIIDDYKLKIRNRINKH